jgi:hypothetical protein
MSLNNVVAPGFQMADPDLTTLSGLAQANSNFIVSDGNKWVIEVPATARTSMGLTIGTNVQAFDANLEAIAGLTSAANKGIQFTGSGAAAVYGLTAAGKALLDDADAAAQRETLELGTAAVLDLAIGIGDGNVTTCNETVDNGDFLKINGTKIEGRSAAEVLSDISGQAFDSKLTDISNLGNTSSRVFGIASGSSTVSLLEYGTVCFLKGTKITLPDYSQVNIEDLTLDDEVLTYNIDVISEIKNKNILKNVEYSNMDGRFSKSGIRNIWINPTDSYLIINDKLNITKNHIIHFKRDNNHYFRYAEHLSIGDELFTDKDKYESVKSIKEVKENINVYNFELDKDNTYFAENYLVHHYCELCSGYANII